MNDHSALEQLLRTQPALWRGQATATRVADGPAASYGTGFAALDAALPRGGWEAGSLTEIMSPQAGIGELSLLLPALRTITTAQDQNRGRQNHEFQGSGRWVAFVSPPYQPYAPALANAGLCLDRLLIIDAGEHTLWAAEQALRSGACGAVVAWPSHPAAHKPAARRDKPALHAHRRLQLAAESGHTWAVLYRPQTCATEHSPAALRLVLQPAPPDRLHIDIIKARRGRPASLSIQGCEFDRSQGTPWPVPQPQRSMSARCRAVIQPDTSGSPPDPYTDPYTDPPTGFLSR